MISQKPLMRKPRFINAPTANFFLLMLNDDLLFGVEGQGLSTPRINPLEYPTFQCSGCGHKLFQPRVVLKEIPGTLVGNGLTPVLYPLQVMVCAKCGKVIDSDIKLHNLEKDFPEE